MRPESPTPRRSRDPLRLILALAVLVLVVAIGWLSLRTTGNRAAVTAEAVAPGDSGRAAARSATASATAAAIAMETWREAPTRQGVDAANLYKNAFALFDRLTEEEKQMIRKPREEVDAAKAAALFEKIRAILDLLRAARGADYCDWGQAPYTFETPMPQIGKAVDLGKLGLWAAAYQFPTDPVAALDTLADRAVLGHHIGDTLIGVVVQTAFESGAHELVLQHAGSFDAVTADRARALLGASPCTVEQCTPTFSNNCPCIIDITPPPPGWPVWSVRSQGVRTKRPAAPG